MTCCSTGLATAYTVTRPGCTVCYASCWRSRCCRLNISSRHSLPYPRPVFLMQLLLTNRTVSCRTLVRHGWRAQYGQQTCLYMASTYAPTTSLFVGELVCRRVGCRRIGLSASWFVGEMDCRRVGLSASWLSASWFVCELSINRTETALNVTYYM